MIDILRNGAFARKVWSLIIVMVGCLLSLPLALPAFGQATSVTNKANYETDTIYELMVDRFYDGDSTNNNPYGQSNSYDSTGTNINDYFGGDWQGVIDKIQYLQDLGITAIWITPPYDNLRAPYYQTSNSTYYNAYHGYWARDYFVPDAHWGSWAVFDSMVAAAHAHNIKVIIDFASNHTNQEDSVEQGAFYKNGTLMGNWSNDTNGYFHHFGDRPDNATTNWDFQYQDLAYLADFSQENGTVIQYMKDAIKVWLGHGIDGIRNDAVLEQDPAFLKIWQDYINNYQPVYTFGEFWINPPDPSYNDYKTFEARTGIGILDFELYNVTVNAFGSFSKNMNDVASTLGYTATDYTYANKAVPFLDSHDKERIASLQPTQSIEHAALAFLLTSRGTPVIYYGTEQYLKGLNGDGGRVPMPGYNNVITHGTGGWGETTTAFKLISKLAGLRKSNDAIPYGTTTVRWVNNDVIIVERQFYNNIVLTAINRSGTPYVVSGLLTALPNGTYPDYLGGLLGGGSATVTSGAIPTFTLGATQVAVWQRTSVSTSVPEIGAVGPTMGRYGDVVTIDGEGFGSTTGTVKFASTSGTVQSWSPTEIKVSVPNVTAGVMNVTVVAGGNTSNTYRYDVLTGPQVMEIFHTTTTTSTGQNVYVVGNVHELDNWATTNVYYPLFNPSYPNWFLPMSVPANTAIQYKYLIRDGGGIVTWQPDPNLSLTTPASGESDATNYVWP